MNSAVAALRRDYTVGGLAEADAGADPFALFQRWFEAAVAAGLDEPNAMTLATVDETGAPDARIVLLKGHDPQGFVFFTNHRSVKGRQLTARPMAALVFHWSELERQVRVRGVVEHLPRAETEAYFAGRPRGSQLGAWASAQSEAVPDREALEAEYRAAERRFGAATPVPAPPHWGGYRVQPDRIEFWQGRSSRLHDRLRYTADPGKGWRRERLAP